MVDLGKMRKAQESQQKGGDFLNFENGETLVYIHPECRPDDTYEPTDGLNYVPIVVHYKVGSANAMVASLDPNLNKIIVHPFVKAFLKKKKILIKDGQKCPVSEALRRGEISGEDADESRAQTKFIFGMTPLKYRTKSSGEWANLSANPSIAMIGKQIYDGIMDVFNDHGDITDPEAAILVRIVRSGKDRNTKYVVKVEPETVKRPFKLPSKLRAQLALALQEGGDCDLFRIAANLIKSPAEVQALVDGVKVETDPDDLDDDAEDDDDVPAAKPKPKKPAAPPPEDEEEEEEEEAPPPPKKTSKKAPPPPEDEEEEEEEEEAPPPPPKKKAVKKAAPPPPAEDEEEDEEEEEEEAPPPPKKKAVKKPEPPEEDDEEEEEEEEAPPPPKKASKKAKPADEDEGLGVDELQEALDDLEDDEDEEEEEEEAPPPPKKKTSKK